MQTPQTAAAYLKKISRLRPTLAIVLGSGFHHVLAELRVDKKISYAKIPGFPKPTVAGHAGELYFGHLGKMPVIVLSGRVIPCALFRIFCGGQRPVRPATF